jgi:hypothetical protein
MTRTMQQFGRSMKKIQEMPGRKNKMPAPDISKTPMSHRPISSKKNPDICEICGMRMTSHKEK